MLPRLRGDFALLIWDGERGHGLLARDQLGVRGRCSSTGPVGGLRSPVTCASCSPCCRGVRPRTRSASPTGSPSAAAPTTARCTRGCGGSGPAKPCRSRTAPLVGGATGDRATGSRSPRRPRSWRSWCAPSWGRRTSAGSTPRRGPACSSAAASTRPRSRRSAANGSGLLGGLPRASAGRRVGPAGDASRGLGLAAWLPRSARRAPGDGGRARRHLADAPPRPARHAGGRPLRQPRRAAGVQLPNPDPRPHAARRWPVGAGHRRRRPPGADVAGRGRPDHRRLRRRAIPAASATRACSPTCGPRPRTSTRAGTRPRHRRAPPITPPSRPGAGCPAAGRFAGTTTGRTG